MNIELVGFLSKFFAENFTKMNSDLKTCDDGTESRILDIILRKETARNKIISTDSKRICLDFNSYDSFEPRSSDGSSFRSTIFRDLGMVGVFYVFFWNINNI